MRPARALRSMGLASLGAEWSVETRRADSSAPFGASGLRGGRMSDCTGNGLHTRRDSPHPEPEPSLRGDRRQRPGRRRRRATCCSATAARSTARCTRPRATWTRAWPGACTTTTGASRSSSTRGTRSSRPTRTTATTRWSCAASSATSRRRPSRRNADSHLTFIGSGMRNCVTYRNQPLAPVYFIDLDGTNGAARPRAQDHDRGLRPGAGRGARVVRGSRLAPPDRLGEPRRPAHRARRPRQRAARRLAASTRAGSTSRCGRASATSG